MAGRSAFRPRCIIVGMLKSESERIALVRTIAPLVWSFILLRLADWGLQFDTWAADTIDGPGGIDDALINSGMTVVLAVGLWLLARLAPGMFERLLMWIPVSGYAYARPDDSLVVPAGTVEHAAGVLDITPDAVDRADSFVQTYIARQPSPVALRAAAAQLLEAADTVR